jgi:ABC-2 type transport system permease protein
MSYPKYFAFARIAARRQLKEPGDLYGTVVFFAVMLGVFSALWRAVNETQPHHVEPALMVWYLAATEWILLSVPQLHAEIQEDVRRGDVAVHLPRPVSYLGAMIAQGLGALLVRAPLLAVTGAVCAFAITRAVPDLGSVALLLAFGICASVVLTVCYVALGLLSFWIGDVAPLYWLWQKSLFVLGGLMLPLSFYPAWLRAVAWWTPFPVLLSGPASFLLPGGAIAPAELGGRLAVWTLLVALAAIWLFHRAVRGLSVRGG